MKGESIMYNMLNEFASVCNTLDELIYQHSLNDGFDYYLLEEGIYHDEEYDLYRYLEEICI